MRQINIILILGCLLLQSCSGCSKSGRFRNNTQSNNRRSSETSSRGSNVVKMIKKDGVYEIPIEINGVSMIFIFDTGAGLISISNTEAGFLYKQGKLTQEDIIGKANFMDANGDISVGTIIRLKTVQIGNKILYNVEASVVNNTNAPLLMGQSALEQFGKVSIDYNAQTITFD